jgi:phosphoglycolate phosphatase-like HAD superfamily hydrolase
MPPLILFDIDLTLIHTSGAGRRAMTAAFQRLWDLDNPTEGVSFDGRTDRAIFREVIAKHSLANGDLEAVYGKAVEAYLAELPGSLAASTTGRLLPGVADLLDALVAEGIRPGLATGNIRRGAALKLGHFGIWDQFAGGGFGDDHPVRADLVRGGIVELAGLLGCDPDPSRAVVIGDTPLDVEAAHLAGARALAVATGSYSVEQLTAAGADLVMADLSDTGAVLRVLVGG